MYEEQLNDGELLSKVTKYELDRGTSRVFIDIHELVCSTINEEIDFKFLAVPNHVLGNTNQKYIAKGQTEREALAKCLSALKDVDFSDIREQD